MSSTRIMVPVELVPRELDLSAYGHDALVDKLNIVPGLRTSTAFFTFLRANLVAAPSAASSPYLGPTSSHSWAAPSHTFSSKVHRAAPGAAAAGRRKAAMSELPVVPDDLPPLSIGVLDVHEDKVDALELVAESIAQQRHTASRYLALHPCLLAGLTACLAATQQFSRHCNLGTSIVSYLSVMSAYLLTIRFLTGGYSQLAKSLRCSWLLARPGPAEGIGSGSEDDNAGHGVEDTVIGVRFRSELIGALVLRLENPTFASSSPSPSPSGSFSSHSRSASNSSICSSLSSGSTSGTATSTTSSGFTKRHRARNSSTQLRRVGGNGSGFYTGKGVIRAWTIKDTYRGQGVGADLLHEAVRLTRERCGRDAAVGFASRHAHSATMDLPEIFCGHVRRAELKATRALEDILKGWEESRRRRKM
ncbi:GNAT family N-acetyltransferase [Microdochium nivale]|nr:GNAT family N-acetyltransferase [Microdochium nivale]